MVHLVPVRVLASQTPRTRQRQHTEAQVQLVAEAVPEVTADHDLRGLPLAGIRGPAPEVVVKIRIVDPALEVKVDLVDLHVVAQVERGRPAECISVGVIETGLVQVADVGPGAEVDVAVRCVRQLEAGPAGLEQAVNVVSRVRRWRLRRRFGLRRRRGTRRAAFRAVAPGELELQLPDARVPCRELPLQRRLPLLQPVQALENLRFGRLRTETRLCSEQRCRDGEQRASEQKMRTPTCVLIDARPALCQRFRRHRSINSRKTVSCRARAAGRRRHDACRRAPRSRP